MDQREGAPSAATVTPTQASSEPTLASGGPRKERKCFAVTEMIGEPPFNTV